jgi:hypothetical protein
MPRGRGGEVVFSWCVEWFGLPDAKLTGEVAASNERPESKEFQWTIRTLRVRFFTVHWPKSTVRRNCKNRRFF